MCSGRLNSYERRRSSRFIPFSPSMRMKWTVEKMFGTPGAFGESGSGAKMQQLSCKVEKHLTLERCTTEYCMHLRFYF